MEDDEIVDINVETEKEEKYMLEIKKRIRCDELKLILKQKIVNTNNFDFMYKDRLYKQKDKDEIINLEQGEKIYTFLNVSNECFEINADFFKNLNLNEADMTTIELSGLLQLFLFKYIARNTENINKIKNKVIREIISDLKKGIKLQNDQKENIKAELNETNGNNILAYSNYINSLKIKKQEIENLINELFTQDKKKDIISFWSILSKYKFFNDVFEKDFNKAVGKSYFDFSLISLSLYQHKRRTSFLEALKECTNTIIKCLFHGTQLQNIPEIIGEDFKYTRRALFGMGIYFTDKLDYASYYAGGTNLGNRRDNFNKINSVGDTLCCIASTVYYDREKKTNIYNDDLFVNLDHFPTYKELKEKYKDKMVQKYGVHYVRVEAKTGSVKGQIKIETDKKKGVFIGTEYVITEMDQILPLYGLTLKRNEYIVIWRDPGFNIENNFSEYLRDRRRFIFKQAKMNGFFDSSMEKLLEIIKRKKYNKIILLSNCGKDLSGKKFVEIARKILGFDVMVLFFSANKEHFNWIQKFPNALYTKDPRFYEKYINNYNKDGLLQLKQEIEKEYKIKLKFTDNFLEFPKFVGKKKYDELIFEDICPHIRKVVIKNRENKKALLMDKNGEPCFKSTDKLETDQFIWYITLINNEITLFSNESYLYFDRNSDVAKFKAMEKFQYEQKDKKYLIYYGNKNNTLTVKGDKISFEKEKPNQDNQLFEFIDEYIED